LERRRALKEGHKAKEVEILKNTIFSPNFLKLDARYRIKIIHCFENPSNEIHRLDFQASIKYIGNTESGSPLLRYQKEPYKVNDQEPDLKLYDLAIQCTDFIYPIEFSLNAATFPHEIVNLKEIESRWKKTKERIHTIFPDSYSKTYVETMDRAINEGLQKYIMRDLYLQLFFAPYAEYTKGQSSRQRRFQKYRIQYQDIMDMEIEQDLIMIKQNAYCIDPRTPQQILSGWDLENDSDEENTLLLESSILGEYHLDKQYKTLQMAKVKIETSIYGEDENLEIQINRL